MKISYSFNSHLDQLCIAVLDMELRAQALSISASHQRATQTRFVYRLI